MYHLNIWSICLPSAPSAACWNVTKKDEKLNTTCTPSHHFHNTTQHQVSVPASEVGWYNVHMAIYNDISFQVMAQDFYVYNPGWYCGDTVSVWLSFPSSLIAVMAKWYSIYTMGAGDRGLLLAISGQIVPGWLLWWWCGCVTVLSFLSYCCDGQVFLRTPCEQEIGDCCLLSRVKSYQMGCFGDSVAVWLSFPSSLIALMVKWYSVHLGSGR